MIRGALALCGLSLALTACLLPPLSSVIYHHYSDLWPPAKAMKVVDLAQAPLYGMCLHAAIEAGLFESLEHGPLSAEDVAAATGTVPRLTEGVLVMLATLDLLQQQADGRFALGGAARDHLLKSSDSYLGGISLLTADITRRVPDFPALLRGEVSVPSTVAVALGQAEDPASFDNKDPLWRTFSESTTQMMEPDARALSRLVVSRVGEHALAGLEVLDMACGTGTFGFTLARESSRLRLTSFDQEHVIPQTRRWADQFDVAKQTTFLSGNMFEADLKGPYDVIILSHVLHHFDEATSVALLQRLRAALKPGGLLAINEFIRSEGPVTPWEHPGPQQFRTVMAITTEDGDAYTAAKLERVLQQSGFVQPVHTSNAPHPSTVTLAANPQSG